MCRGGGVAKATHAIIQPILPSCWVPLTPLSRTARSQQQQRQHPCAFKPRRQRLLLGHVQRECNQEAASESEGSDTQKRTRLSGSGARRRLRQRQQQSCLGWGVAPSLLWRRPRARTTTWPCARGPCSSRRRVPSTASFSMKPTSR